MSQALNDDLSSKFDDRINSTDKQLLDRPVNANMATRAHFPNIASGALFRQSSNCLSLLYTLSLNFGRRSSIAIDLWSIPFAVS